MAIRAALPKAQKSVKLVFAQDPDVKPKDAKAWGWIEESAAVVSDGADRVTVKALGLDARAEAQDAQIAKGFYGSMLAWARLAGASDDFLASIGSEATTLLGAAVRALTDGIDIAEAQAPFRPEQNDDTG